MENKINVEKNYSIGLDIGNASVGWAVIDDKNKIIRKNNGNRRISLWGVRLFEEASTAEDRRIKRSTRRRYDRRRTRINLLKKEFKEEIDKVDSNFFKKLKESFYNQNDKINKKHPLSKEEKEQVKKYYEKYPTIYHLRQDLIISNEKKDIRLVYLALHHIIKYRGNFLYENDSFSVKNLNIEDKLNDLIVALSNLYDVDMLYTDDIIKCFEIDSKKEQSIELKKVFNYLPKGVSTNLANALVGYSFSVDKLFNIELEKEYKINLKGNDYEDKKNEIEDILGDKIEIMEIIKELYDMLFLKDIFKGSSSLNLSSLMIERYEKHCINLKILKNIIKQDRAEYIKIFKTQDKKICAYDSYMSNKNIDYDNKKFLNELKKSLEITLPLVEDKKLKEQFYSLIEPLMIKEEVVIPKITDTTNSKYPYQLNKDELINIIERQGKYYPFLLDKVNNKYKIVQLLEFRIPYYVGPLHNYTSNELITNPNMWMIRKKNNEFITPYNFDEIVDKDASAEKFILRMIGNCTYLLDKKSIPASSILYSEFKVLNELKQMTINGMRLDAEQQSRIYHNLFLNNSGLPAITDKMFKHYLKTDPDFAIYEDYDIKGYSDNGKFANNMQSYIDFFGNNGIFTNTKYGLEEAEEIISWITIFEDKSILERKVKSKYSLSDEKIAKIVSKRYKGWSRLSKELLLDIKYYNKDEDKYYSIMDLMRSKQANFMKIINDEKYKFNEIISKYNQKNMVNESNYDIVSDLVTSPSTKRGIYQALLVVEEIVRFIGYKPKTITIEMARGDEKKERKDSKKDYIEGLYKKYANDIDNYNKLTNELKAIDKIDNEKLFLYFIQEGKSLYSGKRLDVNCLELYEVDHIIPQTLIKDDSIDNKALVLKEENQKKAYNFVLPKEYRNDYTFAWWKRLYDVKLISRKKYDNLRRSKYSEDDINGFINRQLVETRQITKHVASILEKQYENTKVIYLPASLSSNYRKKFGLFKFRDINDFHHAHDAYLASVLGNYRDKYLHLIDYEEMKLLNQKFYENKQYKEMKYGYIINSLDNRNPIFNKNTGEIIFEPSKLNKIVANNLYRNDILISKKTEIRDGKFYDETKLKKEEKGVRLKKNMPIELYGAYTTINPAYAVMVEYTIKGKVSRKMIGIPILVDELDNKHNNYCNDYIKKLLNLKENDNFEIVSKRIPFQSHLLWDGQDCYLVGATDRVEVCNGQEFYFDKASLMKWKNTLNILINKRGKNAVTEEQYNRELGEIIDYVLIKIKDKYKLYSNLVPELMTVIGGSKNDVLSIEIKEKILLQLFKLLKVGSGTANLKDLGLSIAFGKKNDRRISKTKKINSSVTGMWEEIDEL